MDSDRKIKDLDRVVLFDGVCTFCNGSVDFILRNEKKEELLFTPLQSKTGQELLSMHGYPTGYLEGILFLANGKLLAKSTAALSIARYLKVPFSWLILFFIFPMGFRDFFYDFLAKRRYQWFGKSEACRIPTAELRKRFLE